MALAKKRIERRYGFTLIELLVVIAIISVLAVIALPQFQSYRKRVYDIGALSDLDQFRRLS